GQIARLAGVTVRTLHHYDELGLVKPTTRTDAGYRLYGTAQVERLQEVLFFRELGFGLDEIGDIVGSPGYDRTSALVRQRAMLEAKAERVLQMIDAVDAAIDANERGVTMGKDEMLEVFGDFDPSEYEDEVRRRWGHTEAYRESQRRVAGYTKADWERIGGEAAEINEAFVTLMRAGVAAASPEAMEVAERHRTHIGSWFYDCSVEVHRGLAEMYVSDRRFTENIDRTGEGLAQYMAEAIVANADR
ncbi:MAG: MerR family transcriptional regulator, partial [Thermoanaerobaculia bacterium]|nr:MerR family transcriptional regulator [Thermoanaerobaculia bacterium]